MIEGESGMTWDKGCNDREKEWNDNRWVPNDSGKGRRSSQNWLLATAPKINYAELEPSLALPLVLLDGVYEVNIAGLK